MRPLKLLSQQKKENQWKYYPYQCQFKTSAFEAVFAFFYEHAGKGYNQHADPKNIRVVNPPIAGILMELGHLT